MLRIHIVRRGWTLVGMLVAMSLASGRALAADEKAKEAGPAAAKERHVLYLTHSAGFNHPVLGFSEKMLKEMGEKNGIKVTALEGYKQPKEKIDLKMITPDYLKQFDAVILYTTGELPLTDEQKKALVDYVKEGKALVGIHSATDTLYQWSEYMELMGAQFKTHAVNDDVVTIKIEDPEHPTVKMLAPEFKIADEIYQTRQPVDRKKFRVLMSIDTSKTNLEKQKMEKDKVYDMAWCRRYGKGRVFYTALGHREDVWTNPKFQEHVIAGIKWAMGDLKGNARPTDAPKLDKPQLPAKPEKKGEKGEKAKKPAEAK